MILRKLRHKRKWSQEQLAEISGLSVRTVQRIEAGGKASWESLKSLASVFEVDISTLEQEITVIDKTTEDWKKVPVWLRSYFYGTGALQIPERKLNIRAEQIAAFAGCVLLAVSPFHEPSFRAGLLVLFAAYGISLFTRAGDKYSIW